MRRAPVLAFIAVSFLLSACSDSAAGSAAETSSPGGAWASEADERAAANESLQAELQSQRASASAARASEAAAASSAAAAAAEAARPPYTITCHREDLSGPTPTFDSLAKVWAYGEAFKTCSVEMRPTYQPTANELAAVALYQKFVPNETPSGALTTMVGICAETGTSEDDAFRWQQPVLQGALSLCPDAPHAGVIGPRARGEAINDGTYTVGSNMQPGTWVTAPGVHDCYWERTSAGGQTVANDFITFAPNGVTVTVRTSDGGFVSQGCGFWHKSG
jgi:hypothetical protein